MTERRMALRIEAMETATAQAFRAGAPDAYGAAPERTISDGGGNPCRHCLKDVPEGAEMLILAWRPFPAAQPYAETGPVFLCAGACARAEGGLLPPRWTAPGKPLLLKAYGADHRLRYGAAGIAEGEAVMPLAADLLADPETAYVDARYALTNCFQFRIRRA